jgi:mRNA interferase RelE/StbE
VIFVEWFENNRNIQQRIRRAIEQRLMTNPVHFGQSLRQALKGYRKLRVGDYRVIYEIRGAQIRIYAIGHRKDVYEKRLRSWEDLS